MLHSQELYSQEAQRLVAQLSKLRENIDCFDCCLRKTSCANFFNATFVCSFCGGLLRELGHVVKKINSADFTPKEADFLQAGGNKKAISIWRNIPASELGLQMLEFQDISGTREHLKQKYLRRRWFKSPVAVPAPIEKPKFKIQPRFFSDNTPSIPKDVPKKALDLASEANDDVMFVKPQPRRQAEYSEEKFDSFGFSDKFSRMYIKHTSPQMVTDMPLEAVTYSFDAFVPKIDAKLREERQRAKAAALEAQRSTPFPTARPNTLPITPQQSPDFPSSSNYISELPKQTPYMVPSQMNSVPPSDYKSGPSQFTAHHPGQRSFPVAHDPFH
ncbi:hypothetical protein DSO57_1035588 [Entomophthora muscae]|uniref:Uncharacterized protein n=1 Tax=Entomophthora muscae TaxID=34485 RepID=A0ACC2RQH2_9FUNG|nr:hypothetical protein DSO57_1035588 [Entomophthora muscae]